MARGRKPIVINAHELQEQINQLEAERTFANRSELWAAIELTPWALAQQPRPLKGQVAMLKAKEYNLNIKTAVGKRGREKGCGPIPGGGRKKRKMNEESLLLLKTGIPKENREKLEKVMAKVEGGSMKAAIKLKCLDCCNWVPSEISACEIKGCSLWNFRPYKKSATVVKELL